MIVNRITALLVALTVLANASNSFGWSASGHQTVAMVAWDQLDPPTRQKLVAILDQHKLRDRDLLGHRQQGDHRDVTLFLNASTWPDTVKSPNDPMTFTENHPTWHYVDYPVSTDGTAGPMPTESWDGHSDPANLLQAMQKITAEFADPRTALDRRAIDLCWLEHLVGDIHQPLHASSYYSKDFSAGDRGGNSYMTMLTGHITALHGYWDGLEGRGTGETFVTRTAKRIEAAHPLSKFADQLKVDDVTAWAKESNQLAMHVVYDDGKLGGIPRDKLRGGNTKPPAAPSNYDKVAHETADRQIALGGYRLAKLLNTLVGSLPRSAFVSLPATAPASATRPAN